MSERPNWILEFLTAEPKPDGDACRANRRIRSAAKVELAWVEGGVSREIRGRLRDVSRAGAALIVRVPPPTASTRVLLRLTEGEGTPWVEAAILGSEPEPRDRHRIRLHFVEPCPSFLLRLAVLGVIEAETEPQRAPCEWPAWIPDLAE